VCYDLQMQLAVRQARLLSCMALRSLVRMGARKCSNLTPPFLHATCTPTFTKTGDDPPVFLDLGIVTEPEAPARVLDLAHAVIHAGGSHGEPATALQGLYGGGSTPPSWQEHHQPGSYGATWSSYEGQLAVPDPGPGQVRCWCCEGGVKALLPPHTLLHPHTPAITSTTKTGLHQRCAALQGPRCF